MMNDLVVEVPAVPVSKANSLPQRVPPARRLPRPPDVPPPERLPGVGAASSSVGLCDDHAPPTPVPWRGKARSRSRSPLVGGMTVVSPRQGLAARDVFQSYFDEGIIDGSAFRVPAWLKAFNVRSLWEIRLDNAVHCLRACNAPSRQKLCLLHDVSERGRAEAWDLMSATQCLPRLGVSHKHCA